MHVPAPPALASQFPTDEDDLGAVALEDSGFEGDKPADDLNPIASTEVHHG